MPIHCAKISLGICWLPATPDTSPLFAFPQFMAALALLAVVYTATDVRYRFRLEVAPLSLYRLTYVVLAAIGLSTLLTDLWSRESWLVPQTAVLTGSLWRATLAALFLLLTLTWLYYAFIRPPVFGRRNAFRYARCLYQRLLKGSDVELPIIADELARSASALIAKSALDPPRYAVADPPQAPCAARRLWLSLSSRLPFRKSNKPSVERCAHDILLMIANRRFCRYMVMSAPGTVIELFNEAAKRDVPGLPLGQFARNVATEAFANKDSSLYHEDEGFESGYFGYVKPFSHAVFGNFDLVEGLGDRFGSPLDIDYRARDAWDAEQLEAYTRCALITFNDYLNRRQSLFHHSFALHRALSNIEQICSGLYMHDVSADTKESYILSKFRVAAKFMENLVKAIDSHPGLELGPSRADKFPVMQQGFCYKVAEVSSQLLFYASTVKSSGETFSVWHVQHNIAWNDTFGHMSDGGARRLINFQLRRLLFDEIKKLEKFPNYQSARILGLCLYVMGLTLPTRANASRSDIALKKSILSWTKKGYLRLIDANPDVAAACLVGSVTYDFENRRLVKTYIKGLDREPPKEYLLLDGPEENGAVSAT
jgi:hypothetical protein